MDKGQQEPCLCRLLAKQVVVYFLRLGFYWRYGHISYYSHISDITARLTIRRLRLMPGQTK